MLARVRETISDVNVVIWMAGLLTGFVVRGWLS